MLSRYCAEAGPVHSRPTQLQRSTDPTSCWWNIAVDECDDGHHCVIAGRFSRSYYVISNTFASARLSLAAARSDGARYVTHRVTHRVFVIRNVRRILVRGVNAPCRLRLRFDRIIAVSLVCSFLAHPAREVECPLSCKCCACSQRQ